MSRTRYLNKRSLRETLALFVDAQSPLESAPDVVPVEASVGRVTAVTVFSRRSVPHYHGAAMDGIAVRAEDTFGASDAHPITLTIVDRSATDTAAGRTCAYVDTGHPLPGWANAVVMIEHIYPAADGAVSIRQAAAPWQHVRLVGEDIVATEPLLPRGHRLRPVDVGALLAAGHVTVDVMPLPRIAIIPTGSELVDPGGDPPPGGIIEFNSRMVAAFVTEWGGAPSRLPAVPDDPEAIAATLRTAAAGADVVTIIAGSSAGEHDYTVGAIASLGTVLVHGIDIMPGKPAICARIGTTPVLGVPGYPVSAVIVCRQVLRPLLARLLGTAPQPPETVRAVVPRKVPSRLGLEEFVRVSLGRVGERVVAAPLGRGAGAITTFVKADGLLRIGSLSEGVNAGDEVDVELLRARSDIDTTIVFSGSHDLSIGLLEDALKRIAPQWKISAANVGSLGGLLALKRGEAHVVGTHLLDPTTGAYNLPEVRRRFRGHDVVVVRLLIREQGLIVAPGNPRGITGLRDLRLPEVRFVNRQPGAGTRVLLDHKLSRLRIRPDRIRGYEREEFTHMAVAVAVASGLADCGLGVQAAANALGLDFVPIEREDYDLVFRRDFYDSPGGQGLVAAMRSENFRTAVTALGGYDASVSGTVKLGPTAKRSTSRQRAGGGQGRRPSSAPRRPRR